jgi:DNA/RNA endonuclease G (NUC1)
MRLLLLVAAATLSATLAIAVAPDQSQAQAGAPKEKDRNCTADESREGDRLAALSRPDSDGSVRRHLPWGEPRETSPTTNERTFVLTDYVNRYDSDLRVPVWSAERIDWSRLDRAVRINCFRPWPGAVAATDNAVDYDEPVYDQGHLTPAADQDSSVTAMVNTFFFTNMAPQRGQFNRGIWKRLEGIVRNWVQANATVYVITGSVFDRDNDGRRDADSAAEPTEPRRGRPRRMGIPTAFYKIITYRRADGRLTTLSLLLPHQVVSVSGRAAGRYFQAHVTTVARLERLTGLDFFPTETNIGEATDFCSFSRGTSATLCP